MARNYDPVKAHEYYMRTRKLKGRTSTRGFSQADKEMAAYVKEQLRDEMRAEKEKIKERTAKQREQLREQVKQQIAIIRARIKALGRHASDGDKQRLKDQIASIRGKAADARKKITENAKSARQKANEKFKNEYINEVAKIRKKYT